MGGRKVGEAGQINEEEKGDIKKGMPTPTHIAIIARGTPRTKDCTSHRGCQHQVRAPASHSSDLLGAVLLSVIVSAPALQPPG